MSTQAQGVESVEKMDDEDEGQDFVVVRRRKGRRRRRQLQAEGPQQRFRLILFVVVILLMIITLTGNGIRHSVSGFFGRVRDMIPAAAIKTVARPEVVLLLLAAIILIYLMIPGLEEKALRFFGIRTTRRRH